MATTTLFPQTLTNPDQGGTVAFSGASVTGHGSDSAAASAFASPPFGSDSDSESKSARWSSFQSAPGGTITALHLKFDWSVNGNTFASAASGGSASANASYSLQYTIDGGSNWINVSSHAIGPGSSSFIDGTSTDVSLLVGQNIANVQVREFADADADAAASASASSHASASTGSSISNIRIEVTTSDPAPTVSAQLLVMM